jgi:hypothetical protein
MLKQLFGLSILVCFFSCNESRKDYIVSTLGGELEASAEYISQSTDKTYLALQNNLYDAKTKSRAEFWNPIAKKVQLEFNTIYKNIDSLKGSKNIDLITFFKNVAVIKNNLQQSDKGIAFIYADKIDAINKPFDSLVLIKGKNSIGNISNDYKIAILNKVKCNCKILENNISNYCLTESKVFGFCFFGEQEFFHVGQNYSHLKVGETLKIQTAIMKTLPKTNEQITINGKPQSISYGVSTYELKVAGDSGLHKIPIKITFADENGKQVTKTNDVEYFIDK